ncbi:MAG: DUF4625 domain-containing protein [Paludibacter sp.]|nr:DUF4625 domain-containing protein [Paludibacter sp.]
MKKIHLILIFTSTLFFGCDDVVKDEELPVINMSGIAAFPQNCVTVYRGESFTFNALFTDNVELGSYSIEMHHNFDHHTHSTSSTECEMEAIKTPVNPLLFIEEYDIPQGKKSYSATIEIDIPADVDTGDYHFMVRLTDKSGWQTFEGISMKIAER